jgi:hypothetical protein
VVYTRFLAHLYSVTEEKKEHEMYFRPARILHPVSKYLHISSTLPFLPPSYPMIVSIHYARSDNSPSEQ